MKEAARSVWSFIRLPAPPGAIESSRWINEDIRPLPPFRRRWTTFTYLGWWSIWMMGLSNFQVGSSMVAIGMSVWQAMIAVLLGRIIIAIMAVLNGQVGADWHIGFPVFSRVLWGMRGSYLVITLRVLLGLVGFAVQSWNGGLCVSAVLSAIFPSYFHLPNTIPASSNVTTSQMVSWIVFLALCTPMIYVRPERAPKVMAVMNSLTLATLLALTIWSLVAADGGGPMLSQSSQIQTGSSLGWAILGGINNVIGTVAPALMSQPDFSRFARKPGDHIWGQVCAFVLVGTVMPLFGCIVSSTTQKLYGEAIWNPPILMITWLMNSYSSGTRAAAAFAGMGLTISQLAVVVVDNAYALGIDLSGLFPTVLNIRRGAYLGLALGMAFCPWELLSTATVFLTVISSFTVFFGPICGSQVCEYFVVRQRRIKLSDAYVSRPGAIYFYFHGINWRAFASWIVGWAPLFPGLLHAIEPTIAVSAGAAQMYNIAYVLGFAISFVVHYLLNKAFPPPGLGAVDATDQFGTFRPEEAIARGVNPSPAPESSQEEGLDKVVEVEKGSGRM